MNYSARIASRIRMDAQARRQRERADAITAFELVMDTCHPDNLGALPPSPRVLLNKAYLLGLGTFTYKE